MGTEFADIVRPSLRFAAVAASCLTLANCASSDKLSSRVDPKYGVSSSPRLVSFGEPVPRGGGTYRVGKPYTVAGRMYVPEENSRYRAEGKASWYGDDFHGRLTANGEIFDMTGVSAAHPTMPMPSYARVTNLANGKSLIVRVNDRGPYHGGRVIDVSHRAATLLDFHNNGIADVRVEYVGRAPIEGSDDRLLVATLRQGQPAPAPSNVMIASAKPFVPELPAVQRVSLRGSTDVPLPSERPYNLGETMEDLSAPSRTSELSASRSTRSNGPRIENPRMVAYEPPAYQPAPPPSISQSAPSPVSAYAGSDRGLGVTSGRGLY